MKASALPAAHTFPSLPTDRQHVCPALPRFWATSCLSECTSTPAWSLQEAPPAAATLFRGCRTPEQQTFFHVCLDLACCTQHACTGVPAWRASTLSMHDGHVCTLSCIKTPNPSRLPTPVSINALTPAKPCSLPPAQHVRPDTPTPHDTTLWCLAHDG